MVTIGCHTGGRLPDSYTCNGKPISERQYRALRADRETARGWCSIDSTRRMHTYFLAAGGGGSRHLPGQLLDYLKKCFYRQ